MRHGTYCGGYELENVAICFAKVEPQSDTHKVFRIDVVRDLFCGHALQVTKGRTGGRLRVVMRGHDTEFKLLKDLLDLCSRRFEHGYNLESAFLTDNLVPHFDSWIGFERNRRSSDDLELTFFQCLSVMRNLAASSSRFADFEDAFDKTIFSLDPQNHCAHPRSGTETVRQLYLPDLEPIEGSDFTNPRRRVVRFLVEHLLSTEPLVAQSIYRALQVPGRFEGNNIVNFSTVHRMDKGADYPRMLTLVAQEPLLTDLGERLFFSGIKTVRQLISMSEADLRRNYQADHEEIAVLRFVLGQYGLRLTADSKVQSIAQPKDLDRAQRPAPHQAFVRD